jgi:hypothetical protein
MSDGYILACQRCHTAVVASNGPQMSCYRDPDVDDHTCSACGCSEFYYYGGVSR